jgi:surface antigen
MDSRIEGRPALPPRRARQVWARLRIEGRQGDVAESPVERPRCRVVLGIGGIKRHARTFTSSRDARLAPGFAAPSRDAVRFYRSTRRVPKTRARRFMQDRIMSTLFRFGIVLVCLGLSATACAQTYDDSTSQEPGIDCRAIVGNAEIDGTMQTIVGRACLQSDGTWQLMRDDYDGSVLVYPVASYPYPDPWYWGPPIFIGVGASFVFVDRFHHFHHFHHMDHNHFGSPGFHGGFHTTPGGMHGFNGTHGFGGGMHGMGGGMRRR